MLDGYFSYRPAYNFYFSPMVGPYQVTRHGSSQPAASINAVSARASLRSEPPVPDDEQAALRPPGIGSWQERLPASVTTGQLLDVYDTDQ